MGSKKKSTTTTNQTQTAAPPSYALPGITDVANRVTGALGQLPTDSYQGDFIAMPDQQSVDEIAAAYDSAAGRALDLSNQTQDWFGNFLAAEHDNQTGLNDAIDAAIHPVFRQLQEQVLPGLANSAVQSGAYGNNRYFDTTTGQVTRDATENAQRIAATLGYENYQAMLEREIQRASMVPGMNNNIMQLAASQGDLLRQGDADRILRDQAVIDNELAREDYNFTRPFRGLDIASSLLSQLSQGYGTTNMNGTSTTVEKTGGLGSVVQGLAGLGGLAASAFMGPAAGAVGSSIGSAASAAGRASLLANPASAAFPTMNLGNGFFG